MTRPNGRTAVDLPVAETELRALFEQGASELRVRVTRRDEDGTPRAFACEIASGETGEKPAHGILGSPTAAIEAAVYEFTNERAEAARDDDLEDIL